MPKFVNLSSVDITGGFWGDKQKIIRDVTIPAVLRQYTETGRIKAFELSHKLGEANAPHFFWDSDVAKWIEGTSYALSKQRDAQLEAVIDNIADLMERGQAPDGYFNIYYQTFEPHKRFSDRNNHELYCAGHLMEAAVAYNDATGKDKLLRVMCRYADCIEAVFTDPNRDPKFVTCGHEEIELALVKLYHSTNEKRYLNLARHFVNKRGGEAERGTFAGWASDSYGQDHLPVAEQTTAEGHSVRCLYLFAGAADIAREFGDHALTDACRKVFDNIANRRMYVTGGVGSNVSGEAFSYDWDLPNETAYTETCASIAMAMFSHRMGQLTGDAKYYDMVELQIYNSFMSGLSLSGDRFFYTNPLEMHPERTDYFASVNNSQYAPIYERPLDFWCSCCPPNVVRFTSQIGTYMYLADNSKIAVNLYNSSRLALDDINIEQTTSYPWDEKVSLKITADKPVNREISLRIPAWCKTAGAKLNGELVPMHTVNGYLNIDRTWISGDEIELVFPMPVQKIHANVRVYYNAGCVAIKRGPIVYCLESADNGENLKAIRLDTNGKFEASLESDLLGSVVAITAKAAKEITSDALYSDAEPQYEAITAKFIPYYAWANRGRGEMLVWVRT